MQQKPVTILRDADGKAVGVMVETLDERFALELHHIDSGKEYTWPVAMERLKELGLTTFNKKQALVMAAYHDEINKAIEVLAGDKLNWEWSVSEYYANGAWFYCPTYGALHTSCKYYSCQVRPLLASKQIEELLHRAV